MVTDTKRILRTDPGRPEVCNVCQLHRFFGDDYEDDLGRRADRPDRLRRHEEAAGRADHRPLRARPASATSELMADPARIDADPRGRRRAGAADGRGDDGRGPREDGAALRTWARHVTERARRRPGRETAARRAPSSCSATRRPLLHRPRPARLDLFVLRRHPADVLPGLAARVHHQPGRHPDHRGRSRGCRGCWRRSSSTRCVVAVLLVHRRRRRRRAGDLDRRVRRLDPAASSEDLPAIVAPWQAWLDSIGLGQIDLRHPGAGRSSTTSTTSRAVAGHAAPADRGRQPERRRDDADRLLPVDLHGHRPRPDPGLPLPAGAARPTPRRPACSRRPSRARSAASSAARP